ncbi:serine/threonine-protein kinase A-Raf-like [Dysidea avara]|uniref:serine/threonine-protein kinase A-Raf-like n=1 Tax=Dysidea avara TaxID=196820 RepID=UPI003323F9CE
MTATTAAAQSSKNRTEVQSLKELIKMYEWKLDMLRVELKSYQQENHSKDLLVDEEMELCDRLHDLKSELEALQNEPASPRHREITQTKSIGFPISPPQSSSSPGDHSSMPLSPRMSLNYPLGSSQSRPHTPLQNSPNVLQSNSPSSLKSTPLIRVLLPHGQHTLLHPKEGESLHKALQKAMKKRDLDYIGCNIFSVNNDNMKLDLDWNLDTGYLAGQQLFVELKEHYQKTRTIHHNFVRKTFYMLAFCDACRKPLLHGFRCQTCQVKFHQRCSAKVPMHCTLFGSENFFKDLLSQRIPMVKQTSSTALGDDANRPESPMKKKTSHSDKLQSTSTPSFSGWTTKKQESFDDPRFGPSPVVLKQNSVISLSNSNPLSYEEQHSVLLVHRNSFSPSIRTPSVSEETGRGVDHPQEVRRTSLVKQVSSPNILLTESPPLARISAESRSDRRGSLDRHERRLSREHERRPSADHVRLSTSDVNRIRKVSAPVDSGISSVATEPTTSSSIQVSSNSEYDSSTLPLLRRGRTKTSDNDRSNKSNTRDSGNTWEINRSELEIGDKIGSGSFGTVFKGKWFGPVAVKKLNVSNPTESQFQAFKNEVQVLRRTRHVNILLFMGWTRKPDLSIVTQWCDGFTLYYHLHVEETKYEILELVDIARQTSQGMDYLHAKQIIHRDLKSNNIFLHEDSTVKIGDFGLATVKTRWSGSEQQKQPTGSILWMAPEIIRMQDPNPYTFKSDVYAFGVVIYELICQELPYPAIKERDQILFMVGCGLLRPTPKTARSDTPKKFKQLCIDCCKVNKEDRPTFDFILAELEDLSKNLPKFKRSQSEPNLPYSSILTEDLVAFHAPHTPVHAVGSVVPSSTRFNYPQT